jgi:PASTA domain
VQLFAHMTIPPTGDVGTPATSPVGAAPFAVTAPPELSLAADRTGSTSFTITNLTGRPVRARLIPRGQAGALDAWLSVSGPAEVPMAVGGTVTATVMVNVPQTEPVGQHTLYLEVVAEDDTESIAAGQSVSFRVPPATGAKKKFPWWIIIVAAVVLALLVGLGVYFLTRDKAPPDDGPPASGPVNTEKPQIKGNPNIGQPLTAGDGTWSDTAATFARQWQSCNAGGAQCTDIAGATGQTYTVSASDLGRTIRVVVSATNSGGTAQAESAVVGPVDNALVTVPDFSGLSFAEAQQLAGAAGLGARTRFIGTTFCEVPAITGQSPKPNAEVPSGTVVTMFVPRRAFGPPAPGQKGCGKQ